VDLGAASLSISNNAYEFTILQYILILSCIPVDPRQND
jgi:hypothetical protein